MTISPSRSTSGTTDNTASTSVSLTLATVTLSGSTSGTTTSAASCSGSVTPSLSSRTNYIAMHASRTGASNNSDPMVSGVAEVTLTSIVSCMALLALAFILSRRSKNRNMSKHVDDPKVLYAAQLGISLSTVKVMFPDTDGNAAFQIHPVNADDKPTEVAHVNLLHLWEKSCKSFSRPVDSVEHYTRTTENQSLDQAQIVAPTLDSGGRETAISAKGAERSRSASLETPTVIFVERNAEPLSLDEVRIVSTAAPNLQRIDKTESSGKTASHCCLTG
eukprot:gb/GECG01004440.1/.p1 GENE.gb/GECG01004440.1/~~gb/GECG01004440.1/.p1  ORF type:complete len:276 (+),score=23.69 gb/GECG01004440.1/:1-828(+)